MTGHVQTVTGPVDPADLGLTLPHEHLEFAISGWQYDIGRPSPRQDRVNICLAALEVGRTAGVRTMVECTPPEMGRDVDLMRELSERSGVQIVACTGLYARWPTPYFARRTASELAELFIQELESGVADTGVRCGAIKLALEKPELTAHEQAAVEAAAVAHTATGVGIIIHVEEQGGFAALDILTSAGVPGPKIVIGHAESTPDLRYFLRIFDQYNAYAGIDRFGRDELRIPDTIRFGLVTALVAMGHARHIQLSHDFGCMMHGRDGRSIPRHTAQRNYAYLPSSALPKLRRLGVSATDIDQMVVANPAAFLSTAGPG